MGASTQHTFPWVPFRCVRDNPEKSQICLAPYFDTKGTLRGKDFNPSVGVGHDVNKSRFAIGAEPWQLDDSSFVQVWRCLGSDSKP